MAALLPMLEKEKPASIKVCTLLEKPSRRKADVPMAYIGFSVPDQFVLGYGLDFAGHFRNLPFIGVNKTDG